MADRDSRWRAPEDSASRDRHGRPRSEKRKRTVSRSPSRETQRRRADDTKERRSHHAHNDTRDREPQSPADSGRHHQHHHHHHRSSHRHHKQRTSSTRASRVAPTELPYSSRPLSKADYDTFLPLLARYLDIQKGKDIHELDEREVRGRWKSFVGKWNEGSLANGWYDPEYFQEVRQTETPYVAVRSGKQDPEAAAASRDIRQQSLSPEPGPGPRSNGSENEDEDEDDDDYGPRMPDKTRRTTTTGRAGPGIPNLQDLDLRREQAEEDKTEQIAQLRLQRKADRAEQKARLEELVPRAEAGTRERQLEKKREVNEKLKSFRERSPGGAAEVVDDKELMGGGDSVAEYKQAKAAAERRKTERELRREEIERARAAEREEKLREYREREEDTMAVFKEIARQRFG
ncbi:grisea protein [Apiospora hydei]|uniref:Grisea protein n=1 Tax=Apiospora hydei TaxID=1337664 RepID=A0ABR1V453_9PEZI